MTPSRSVLRLGWVIVVLATVAALAGLLARGGPGPSSFVSARGQTVQLSGRGLYRHDSVFTDAGNRGVDAVTLALGVPLLVFSLVRSRRGSPHGGLLLAACLGYFLYVYTTMALGTAWNQLFLVYVVLMSASLFALLRLLGGHELRQRAARLFAGAGYCAGFMVWRIYGYINRVVSYNGDHRCGFVRCYHHYAHFFIGIVSFRIHHIVAYIIGTCF
jgi:hypothetical protein